MKFAVIDFETANSERSSACAIGYAIVKDGKIVDSGSEYIKPEPFEFDGFNVMLHGIDEEMTENADNIVDVWNKIKDKFKDMIIIAHNAAFDMSVLRKGFDCFETDYPEFEYACSCKIASKVLPGMINYKLSTLSDYFNISLDHHNPLSDAESTAQIMIEILNKENMDSLEALLESLKLKTGKMFIDSYKPFSIASDRIRTNLSKIEANTEINTESELFGKTIVFTGTLNSMARKDAAQIVANCGGTTGNSVTKKTNYLVIGVLDYTKFADGHMSSKMKKAYDLNASGTGIQIITEDDFLKMI